MSAVIGEGVSLEGLYDPKYDHTFNLASTVVPADVGKAMTQDVSGNSKAKLAGDGDKILGRLLSQENRISEGVIVGTVNRKGYSRFEYTGAAPVIGNSVVGSATLGSVKDSGAAAKVGEPTVWSVRTLDKTVVVDHGL